MAEHRQQDTRRERAICALLNTPTITEAAIASKVPERTLYRWLSEDTAFVDAYRQARRESVRQATARLQQACCTAVNTLLEVMDDKQSSPSCRVTAARSVLELAFRAVEIEDINERLEALETQIKDNQQ